MEDFFFDGVFGDEFDGNYMFVLFDLVCLGDGLLFCCWVLLGVKDEDIVCGGEVKFGIFVFDGNEEWLYFWFFYEGLNGLFLFFVVLIVGKLGVRLLVFFKFLLVKF